MGMENLTRADGAIHAGLEKVPFFLLAFEAIWAGEPGLWAFGGGYHHHALVLVQFAGSPGEQGACCWLPEEQPRGLKQEANGVPGLLHCMGRWKSCQAASRGEVACQRSRCSRSEEPVVMDVEEKCNAESSWVACIEQQVKSKSTHTAVPGPLVLC